MTYVNPEKVFYDKLYATKKYGNTNHGTPWMNLLFQFQLESWLDFHENNLE